MNSFFSADFGMKLCLSSSKQMEISLSPPLVTVSVTVGKSKTVGNLQGFPAKGSAQGQNLYLQDFHFLYN